MKKVLGLTLVLMMALTFFSTSAFADPSTGPLFGLTLVPVVGNPLGVLLGWEFDEVQIEIVKDDFADWRGVWTFGCIWTPEGNGFNYRAGVNLLIDWRPNGSVRYNAVGLIVGLSKTWDPIEGYVQVNVTSAGVIRPMVGINLFFNRLGYVGDGEDNNESI